MGQIAFIVVVCGVPFVCARDFCKTFASSEPVFHRFSRTFLIFLLLSVGFSLYTADGLTEKFSATIIEQLSQSFAMCLLWGASLALESKRQENKISNEPDDRRSRLKIINTALVITGFCLIINEWHGLLGSLIAIIVGVASWHFDKTFAEEQ